MTGPTTGQRTGGRLSAALIAAWALALLVAWLAINLGDDPTRELTQLLPPTHPYWFGVLVSLGGIGLSLGLGLRAARAFGLQARLGKAVLLLAAGVSTWCVGNLIWFWFNTCAEWPELGCTTGIEVPYPSVADIFYLGAIPLSLSGLFLIGRVLGVRREFVVPRLWIAALLALVALYLLAPTVEVAGVEFGRSWLFGEDYGPRQQVFSVLYMIGNIATLVMASLLLMRARETSGGMLFLPLVLINTGLLFLYLADMVFDQRVTAGTYYNGDVADGLYTVWMVLMVSAFARLRIEHDRLTARLAAVTGGP